MSQKITRLALIEEHLRTALARDELSLVFMPQVTCDTQMLMGAEALVRWNSSTLGAVSPDEFIPIAEKTGLIHNITHFVFGEVISAMREIELKTGKLINLSINLSPIDFSDKNFFDFLKHTDAEKYYSNLTLELTEHMLVDDIEFNSEKLNQFKSLGFKISIDDFGTGFSSLNYLSHFPIDELKIDRSFVSKLFTEDKHQEVCRAMIHLARALRCHCVAEGVETLEQLNWLNSEGCTYSQGYYHYKPMPLADMLNLLES